MDVILNAKIKVRDGRMTSLSGLMAELWDADPMVDDLLAAGTVVGSSYLDYSVEFRFDLARVSSFDSPGEVNPDLYVLIEDAEGKHVFRSTVVRDFEFGKGEGGHEQSETFVEA